MHSAHKIRLYSILYLQKIVGLSYILGQTKDCMFFVYTNQVEIFSITNCVVKNW